MTALSSITGSLGVLDRLFVNGVEITPSSLFSNTSLSAYVAAAGISLSTTGTNNLDLISPSGHVKLEGADLIVEGSTFDTFDMGILSKTGATDFFSFADLSFAGGGSHFGFLLGKVYSSVAKTPTLIRLGNMTIDETNGQPLDDESTFISIDASSVSLSSLDTGAKINLDADGDIDINSVSGSLVLESGTLTKYEDSSSAQRGSIQAETTSGGRLVIQSTNSSDLHLVSASDIVIDANSGSVLIDSTTTTTIQSEGQLSLISTGDQVSITAAENFDIDLATSGTGEVTINGLPVASESKTVLITPATSFGLTNAHNNAVITFTNSATILLTLNTGLVAGFNCQLIQGGAGTISFIGTATINMVGGLTPNFTSGGQYSLVNIIPTSSNEYIFEGDISGV